MPIYEYRCEACNRRASLFFRTIASADSNPECPHCGERRLTRRMSRVWSHRSKEADAFSEPVHEEDGVPFYGADPFCDPYGVEDAFGSDAGADDEGDIAAVAREARLMAQMSGEPLDAEFDAALRHIESGADPDDVFGELDAAESSQESAPPADEE